MITYNDNIADIAMVSFVRKHYYWSLIGPSLFKTNASLLGVVFLLWNKGRDKEMLYAPHFITIWGV